MGLLHPAAVRHLGVACLPVLLGGLAACGGRVESIEVEDSGRGLTDDAAAIPFDARTFGGDAALPPDAWMFDGDAAVAAEDSRASSDEDAAREGDALEDAGVDAPDLAPCSSESKVFYVEGDANNGLIDGGPAIITAAQGSWSGVVISSSAAQVEVDTQDAASKWTLALDAPFTGGALVPGTYEDAGTSRQAPMIRLEVAGSSCGFPVGTFTIYELAYPLEDQAPLTNLLASFEVHCPGWVGAIRGCVRYE